MLAGNHSAEKHILNVFNFMKSGVTLRESQVRSIELTDNDGNPSGILVPVGTFLQGDQAIIEFLSSSRSKHESSYPTRFNVTSAATEIWLRTSIVENANRILFLIQDKYGKSMGHIGLLFFGQNKCEIEFVSGKESNGNDIHFQSLIEIEKFAYEELGLENLVLRVLKSDTKLFEFFSKSGYQTISTISLTIKQIGEAFRLVESDENVSDHFLVMQKNLTESRMAQDQILTAGPSISNRELTYVSDATIKGWNNHHSDYLNKFQSEFAEYVGAKHALATSSCTGALHLSLLALGIGPGDEVLVPEVTWVATASAVRYTGATPIFVDIDPDTWCINPQEIEKKITKKTKAIMPVHLYGFAADMNEISKIAKSHNIAIVEDAAPAIGTLINGKSAGSFGEFGAYSFQGAKMLVTGEGGMLVTSDSDLFERARKIQDHGRKPGTFWIEELGYKYKMNNITAALGLAQLERSERQIEQKRRISGWYKELIGNHPNLSMQVESSGTRSIHWMNSITLDESLHISRDEVMEKLKADGIDTRPVFPAISQYPFWDTKQVAGEVATRVGAQSINLPSGVKLSKKSVERVCEAITSIIG